jgi:uncharacterized membrane protein YoaK (UPF0700 family)
MSSATGGHVTREDVPEELAFAIALLIVAGWVDAIGFLRLGHLFISFMSGNSTVFAVSLGRDASPDARWAGPIVALFVIGVMLGRAISLRTRRWRQPLVLALVGVLLAFATSTRQTILLSIPAMVFAMGVQNAALRKAGETRTSLTYVTGTLVAFAERLTDAMAGEAVGEPRGWLPYLLLWLGFALGAVGGSFAYGALGMKALIVPILLVTVLTILSARRVVRS